MTRPTPVLGKPPLSIRRIVADLLIGGVVGFVGVHTMYCNKSTTVITHFFLPEYNGVG